MASLQHLLTTIKEDTDKRSKASEHDLTKYNVFWFNPKTHHMADCRIYLSPEARLEDALEMVYNRLKVRSVAPMERCRLVAYDSIDDNIYCSLEGREQDFVQDIVADLPSNGSELRLEWREEGSEFKKFLPGGIQTNIFLVNAMTSDFDGPTVVRVQKTMTVREYKQLLAKKLSIKPNGMQMAILKLSGDVIEVKNDDNTLEEARINHKAKVFVSAAPRPECSEEAFLKTVRLSDSIISLSFVLPKTDKGKITCM